MFNSKQELSLNNIYKKLSEETIISTIIPGAKKNTFFSIRNEKNTSASISEYNGKLYIKDFGDASQDKAETWYQLVARKNGWNIDTREGFLKSLNWANKQFNLNLQEPNMATVRNFKSEVGSNTHRLITPLKSSKLPVKIEVKRSTWTEDSLNFWNQFDISKNKLESKHVAKLDYFWLTNPNKDNIRRRFDCRSQLTFVYPYYRRNDGTFMYKLYSPYSKYKWVANVNSSVIENWRFINPSKRKPNLIIQSAFKDIMMCEEYRDNFGVFEEYDFISPISEGIWFSDNWEIIKSKYKKIIYWGNNDWDKEDNPGLAYAKKWSKDFDIPYIINPDWTKASDITDYRKNNNTTLTLKLMEEIYDSIR